MNHDYLHLLPANFEPFPAEALEGTLVDRFEAMVARHPDAIAMQHGDRTITYRELDARANGMAQGLRQFPVSGKLPIALMYRHGIAHLVAQVSALKSGNCYANIDPHLPLERQASLLRDLGARFVLSDRACADQARGLVSEVPGVWAIDTEIFPFPLIESHREKIAPGDIAYVVYTSGSTGTPRGVAVSHRNALHFIRHHTNYMHVSAQDRASQVCPLWTAASAAEIYPALLNGASLHPCDVRGEGVRVLAHLLREREITMYTSAPVLFRLMLAGAEPALTFPAMRMVRLAGERITRGDVELFRRHFGDHCLLRVGYGASEALMMAHHFIDRRYQPPGEVVPVGYAVADTDILICDDQGNEVPAGQTGEIVARGRWLSDGYWQNPAATAERFRPDPAGGGLRRYHTRDLGRIDEQGLLHHLGRLDAHVKLHGKLVLVSDIETALLGVGDVRDAVVLPHESVAGGTELVAFVVTDLDVVTLRRRLARRLPADLMPSRFRVLDALPLQVNNKVDRQALGVMLVTDA